MKKRIIIILSISVVLILGTITALAAFVFTSTINVTNTAGNIEIIEKKFISYVNNHKIPIMTKNNTYL